MTQNLRTILVTAALLACAVMAEAQQAGKIPRIGYLSRDLHPSDSRAPAPRNLEAFRLCLRKLSYVEEKSILVEYRYTEGRSEREIALSEELVRLKVELIVADSYQTARTATKVSTTIPIIQASGADPVATGLAKSLARPGGNVTGLTNLTPQLLGKRLELLKEVV